MMQLPFIKHVNILRNSQLAVVIVLLLILFTKGAPASGLVGNDKSGSDDQALPLGVDVEIAVIESNFTSGSLAEENSPTILTSLSNHPGNEWPVGMSLVGIVMLISGLGLFVLSRRWSE